jgi:hypothetical protein
MLLALVAIKKELKPVTPNKMGQDHRLTFFFIKKKVILFLIVF